MANSNPTKPLDGFRVLDFTQNVAGPLAGQVLADLGAEVIKVEAPGGEAARQITSILPGRPPLATYFLPNNRGKKSVTVDLTTGMPTPDGKPQIIPFQLVDNASGHVLAQAVLAALLNRERHGVADIVRVAMYDVAVGLQANQLTMHLNRTTGARPAPNPASKTQGRKGVGFATQPSDAFRTADGYVVISAYVPKHWEKLCHLLGRPDLLDDERFTDQRSRSINYPELTDELESALTTKTAAQWVDLLHHNGLMACLAYTWKQVVDTPLFAENELALEVGRGDDAVTLIRTPARYSTFSAAVTDPPPAAGEHNHVYLTAPETAS